MDLISFFINSFFFFNLFNSSSILFGLIHFSKCQKEKDSCPICNCLKEENTEPYKIKESFYFIAL